jgi:hypothetical protein
MASEVSRIAGCIDFDDLGKEPVKEEQVNLSQPPIEMILERLAEKGIIHANSGELKQLSEALTSELCEDIVKVGYGAPINRRVINWLRGRVKR